MLGCLAGDLRLRRQSQWARVRPLAPSLTVAARASGTAVARTWTCFMLCAALLMTPSSSWGGPPGAQRLRLVVSSSPRELAVRGVAVLRWRAAAGTEADRKLGNPRDHQKLLRSSRGVLLTDSQSRLGTRDSKKNLDASEASGLCKGSLSWDEMCDACHYRQAQFRGTISFIIYKTGWRS